LAALVNSTVENGSFVGFEFLARGFRERAGQFLVIERGLAGAVFGIDDDDSFVPSRRSLRVPEASVVLEPVRVDLGFVNARSGWPMRPRRA